MTSVNLPTSRAERVLLITLNLAVAAGVTGLVLTPTERHYSIYTASTVSTVVIFAGFIGLLTMLVSGRGGRIGFVSLFVALIATISFPQALGYAFFGRGTDAPIHAGYIKTILSTGEVLDSLVYPVPHLLASAIIQIPGFELMLGMHVATVAFVSMMIAGGALLGRRTSLDFRLCLLAPMALVLAAPKDTGSYTYFKPYLQAVCYSLFFMSVILIPARDKHAKPIIALVAGTTVFIHPFVSIVVFVGLWLNATHLDGTNSITIPIAIAAVLISWVVFRVEFFARVLTTRLVVSLLSFRTFFASRSLTQEQVSLASSALANVSLFNLILWGLGFGLACMLAFSLYIIFISGAVRSPISRVDTILLGWTTVVGGFVIVNAVLNVVNVQPWRPIPMILIVLGPLASRAAYYSDQLSVRRIVLASIVVLAVVSLPAIYLAPMNAHASGQILDSELDGYRWTVEHNQNEEMTTYRMNQERYYSLAFNREQYESKSKLLDTPLLTAEPKPNSPYLLLTGLGYEYPTRLFPFLDHESLLEMETGPRRHKVYSSGELDVYRLNED